MSEVTHIPYPYNQYTAVNASCLNSSFDEFKKMIYGWVEENNLKNAGKIDFDYIFDENDMFNLDNQEKKKIRKWLNSHSDKIIYIPDFSGLEFGIVVDQRYLKFEIDRPSKISVQLCPVLSYILILVMKNSIVYPT